MANESARNDFAMKIHSLTQVILSSLILLSAVTQAQTQTSPPATADNQNQTAGDQPQEGQSPVDPSTQEQSLGDVARASHQNKSAGSVIDNEAMAANRANRSGNRGGAFTCDSGCLAAVKRGVQQQLGLGMTEEQWRDSLAAGEDLLAQDGEWASLLLEIQQRVCRQKSAPANPNSADDLDRRVAKKLIDEVREGLSEISHSMAEATNQAAQAQAVADARALAIKQWIIKVEVERAKSNCLSQPPAPKSSR
jgi:hypothetical protein